MRQSARAIGLLVLLAAVLTAGAPSVIRVHRGDTLSELAAKNRTTVQALQKANHLSGTTIYEGQLLRIPGQNVAPAATRTVPLVYVVQPGDNLTKLGRRLHHSVPWLKARNHLRSSTIVIGQRLVYGDRSVRTTPHVSVSVRSRAAYHRALLGRRTMPSRASVRALIRASAKRHGVPVDLALALSYQESGFQQRVVSPVDAIGVMQVLPSTARSLGRMHGRSYDILSARDNVEAGVTLIADLLHATGDVGHALAGYYQGLGSVSSVGFLPQTRQYVRNITLLRKHFR